MGVQECAERRCDVALLRYGAFRQVAARDPVDDQTEFSPDLTLPTEASSAALATLHPFPRTSEPQRLETDSVTLPTLASPRRGAGSYREDLEDHAAAVYEWFGLASLESQRISSSDSIDPFLSRYAVPTDEHIKTKLVRLRWQGLLPTKWIASLWLDTL